MIRPPQVRECPECGGALENGFVNAPTAGIMWSILPTKWMGIFNSNVEKLQKDWWGFPKLTKENLPSVRCRECKLVLIRYTGKGDTQSAE
jgi:hypothetical protein